METHLQGESEVGTGQVAPQIREAGSFQAARQTTGNPTRPNWSQPEVVVALGIVLALLSLFLPWWSWTLGQTADTYDTSLPESITVTATGFQGWGIVYFVISLVLVAFLFTRTIGRDAVRSIPLPFADWVFYA